MVFTEVRTSVQDGVGNAGVTDFSPYRFGDVDDNDLRIDLFLPGGEDA